MTPDEGLLGSAANGDVVEALRLQHERRYESLLRLGGLLIGDLLDAEDMVSEVFEKAQRAWTRHGLPAVPEAYLRSAVLNSARSEWARRRMATPSSPGSGSERSLSAESVALLHEDERHVILALSELPERQRQCVVLRYYGDLSDSAVAESLGISVGTAKTHVRRGLTALRKRLKETRDE